MSLFADGRYQWRETYFVLFDHKHRPKAADVQEAIAALGPRLEAHEIVANKAGLLESMTVLSHADAAGMDVTYVEGEDVKEQIAELKKEWRGKKASAKEKPHLERVMHADARFDVYHFEEVSYLPDEEDDGPLDPGTLLLVLNKLARLCHGEALDPQTGELLE
ncbi:MAG TPA: hypothetical protein VFV87_22915 [Pirellulaceae bacterium]|nr:hypothetical protein [Pirellulaceae bacterium]